MSDPEALIPLAEPTRAPRPVARVAVDMPLPHLDRPFDYLVGDELAEQVRPGVRVRVRFAGRLRDGFVLELGTESDETRNLAPIEKVVSTEQVLTPAVAGLVRQVADHYAGSFADVVRLAVPPRHAATERATPPEREAVTPQLTAHPFDAYPTGSELIAALRAGHSPRACWQLAPAAAPAGDWAQGLAVAAGATLESGRGALIVVPDARDLERLRAACDRVVGSAGYVVLSADSGPAARYRAFLAVLRGEVRLVIGTRAAAYAPVRDLGLVAIWDDGDDLYAEPRAPYPHTREVLALRAAAEGAAFLAASYGRSAEIEQLIERGWLLPLALTPAAQRRRAPGVRLAADSDWELERDPMARAVRLPHQSFETIRAGLAQGPVLVQVPRAGYLVVLVCDTCREPVRCPHCAGPIRAGSRNAGCDWCGRPIVDWHCPECGGRRWRAPVVGATRTAEELGRAFPGTPVVQSSGEKVLPRVADEPALVIATPGAEPVADDGYAAALLLDAELLLTRADLRAGEEALRRWLNAVALVRPGERGGSVVAVGPTDAAPLQALVRSDPASFAGRELAERAEAHLPPVAKLIQIDGPPEAVHELHELAELPADTEVLGPVERPGTEPLARLTLRCPPASGADLVAAVRAAMGVRSARKSPGAVRVKVDPVAIG
ncbi:primosome assembly protein PriA [Enemella evansiae]|uniref:primosomal protein N' n=1 Tax=Enemella evansiae TaxID=2016499 RepID=UPI000B9735C2|nr:primosomal protein N' [Enemella evansiae]OYO20589.1 primosome assembly protein PriA [Enemella evansiae]